jgi:acetyl esterase
MNRGEQMSDYSGLTPELAAFLEARYSSGAPEVWQAPLEISRKNSYTNLAIRGELPTGVKISHRFITGPSADLPIRIYQPEGYKSLPTIVFYHGGGWVLNNLDNYDVALSHLALTGPFTIVAVNYQKAPENPFPIPFDDCYATLQWAIANKELLSTATNSRGELLIGIMGDSAGANLASAVAIKEKDEALDIVKFQVLIYPCNDSSMNFPSAKSNGEGFGLSTRAMQWFWSKYLSRTDDHKNPYAVPARVQNIHGVAPAIVVTAEFDPLLDDGYNYAQLLKSAGVTTFYREIEGGIHGIFNLNGITALSRELQSMVAREINAILESDAVQKGSAQ